MFQNYEYLKKIDVNYVDYECGKLLYDCHRKSNYDSAVYSLCRDIFCRKNFDLLVKDIDECHTASLNMDMHFISNTAYNAHAYTLKVVKADHKLLKWKYHQIIKGVNLELNSDKCYNYYVTDDGVFFRMNIMNQKVEELNLELMLWEDNDDLITNIKNNNIPFQGLSNFEDYFKKKINLVITL